MIGFIELDRRFRELNKGSMQEDEALHSYVWPSLDGGLGWKELLNRRIVVVLGEAGSGKTEEFRNGAELLNAEEKFAFFIHLDQLVNKSIDQVLDRKEYEHLQKWLHGLGEAAFFLDSVDESKFHKVSDFYSALKSLSRELGSAMNARAKILLSSRITEWQPHTDAQELLRCFPPPTTGETSNSSEDSALLVVQLLPLDEKRVEQFARGRGVSNVQSFLNALKEHHAWEFARRPIDVIDLINFWEDHGTLGSLTELIEYNVQQNLRSMARDVNDSLSEERAREGAEALSAATVFCRQFSFKIPDDALLVTGALDTSFCLPENWSKVECRSLLQRPIFDCESFGRIRFHHRRVAEYLTASWLRERIKEGCPLTIVEDLFFECLCNRRVLRPALAPVAAWLCCGDESWNGDIRKWILDAAPQIHMQYGDPSCLPLAYKRSLLDSLALRFAGRQQAWLDSSPDSLSRLADPRLSDDVSRIIRDASNSVDLRAEMLLLARHGRLTGCLDEALQIMTESNDKLKAYAAALIRDVGDIPSRRRLAEIVAGMPNIPTRICSPIFEALYPRTINASEFACLLRKLDVVPWHDSLIFFLKTHFESALKSDGGKELLVEIVHLMQTPPYISLDKISTPLSAHFSWLGAIIQVVLQIFLLKAVLTGEEEGLSGEALWLLSWSKRCNHLLRIDDLTSLREGTIKHPLVRRHYFWRLVEDSRRENQREPIQSHGPFNWDEILQASNEDLKWAIDDISNRVELKDRQLALSISIELWDKSGRRRNILKNIKRRITQDHALKRELRRLVAAGRWIWLKRIWYQKIRYFLRYKVGERSWWSRRLWDARNWIQAKRWQITLLWHLRLLASGKPVGWLGILVEEADQENRSKWTPTTWEGLRKKRGRSIAHAAREGCKRAWRLFSPMLPHEKPEPSQTDRRVIVGLAGMQAAIEDGDIALCFLNHDDAILATRYAVNELNGFAVWLDELAKYSPDAVGEVLAECIQGEWKFGDDRERSHEVLAALVWSNERFASIVHDTILRLLQIGDPCNASILKFALSVLLKVDQPPFQEVAELAQKRIKQCLPNEAWNLWMCVWLQCDASKAVDKLEEVLSCADGAEQIMVRLCAALSIESISSIPAINNPSYLEPAQLARFIPIAYKYLTLDNDIHRADMVGYSPGSRDHAQEFRNSLFVRLANSKSPDAGKYLQALSSDPCFSTMRDYILHLHDKWLEKQSELVAWEPSDIRVFAKEYEIDPKTDTDLFKILTSRLGDIKHDVEKADTSIRQDLHQDDDEIRLRKWFANQLNTRSRRRYVVPQEEEIDQRQRPDLRIENPKVKGPVSIEIKWVDKWSIAQLYDGLENQLVAQYLHDANARYGVYLLGYIGRQGFWINPDDKQHMNFDEVVQLLEKRAKSLAEACPDIQMVIVIGIDFRSRETTAPVNAEEAAIS